MESKRLPHAMPCDHLAATMRVGMIVFWDDSFARCRRYGKIVELLEPGTAVVRVQDWFGRLTRKRARVTLPGLRLPIAG